MNTKGTDKVELETLESIESETRPSQAKVIEAMQSWVMDALDHKPLSLDDPFFDGLTLGEYLALSDEEESTLWDKWEGTALYDMDEIEVTKNATLVFLQQAVNSDDLPFQPMSKRPNDDTLEAMLELEQGGGQVFNSTKELFADWEG